MEFPIRAGHYALANKALKKKPPGVGSEERVYFRQTKPANRRDIVGGHDPRSERNPGTNSPLDASKWRH